MEVVNMVGSGDIGVEVDRNSCGTRDTVIADL